jgi:group I intron endonuclease
MIGIYKIVSPSGRVYIGQSKDMERRFIEYNKLKCKKQRKLYSSFMKYGVDKHMFYIVEECNIDELNIVERKWQDYYDVTSKNTNERYLNSLISQGKEGSLNINSFQKFLENSHPSLFGTNRPLQEWEKARARDLRENLKPIYYGMSKAFKKTFDNAKVTSKISSSIAFPLKYESIDFTIENGYFRGDTEKRKQKEVVEPIFNLLKDGADFTNSKAVLFSNSEINDGLFALQRSEIEERMNNSSMMRLNSKKEKSVTLNEDEYFNQPKGKYTEYVKYDNKTILNEFLSKTKDPSDIRLTYLKNTNVKGFASFIFENKEGVKMQMFVPTENLKGMPLYEKTKLTTDEQIFRAKGNTLQLEDNGPVKQVYLKVNKDNEYVLSYNRLVAGDNRRFEKAIPGAYFGATKLDDVISRANQIVKTVTDN